MLAMAGEHHSEQRCTLLWQARATAAGSPAPSTGGRPRGEIHQTAAAAVAAVVDLLALAAGRATSRSSCAQHRSGRGAAWSTCPRPPQPTRPPPRRSEGPPAGAALPGPCGSDLAAWAPSRGCGGAKRLPKVADVSTLGL